jgi:hypothetical protein
MKEPKKHENDIYYKMLLREATAAEGGEGCTLSETPAQEGPQKQRRPLNFLDTILPNWENKS